MKNMPRPYCGGKSPPSGRALAEDENRCRGQVRLYGRRLVREGPSIIPMVDADGTGRGCGARANSKRRARMKDCKPQFRLYGLLPIIDSADDLAYRSFLADSPEGYARLPSVNVAHKFAARIYDGRGAHSRGSSSPLLFVSVVWKGLEDADAARAAQHPQAERGATGFAFGQFALGRRGGDAQFNIAHVYVNSPYRGRAAAFAVAPWLISTFVTAIRRRYSELLASGRATSKTLLVRTHEEAPCLQIGHAHYNRPGSRGLAPVYEAAGFTIETLAVGERAAVRRERF